MLAIPRLDEDNLDISFDSEIFKSHSFIIILIKYDSLEYVAAKNNEASFKFYNFILGLELI